MEYVRAFRKTAHHFPDRIAIETLDGDTYSYADLDSRTDRLAAALDDQIGDNRCAALLLNGPEAFETILAAQKRGRANVQLSYRATEAVLTTLIETAEANGLVFDEATADAAATIIEETDLDVAIPVGDAGVDVDADTEIVPYEEILEETSDTYVIDNEPPAESVILFTSGTTGVPKGAVQNQEQSWLASSQAVMEQGFDAEDVGLVMTPWYHDVTLVTSIFNHFQVGGRLVPQPTFDPEQALKAIEARGVTNILAVPTQLDAMLDVQQTEKYDLSSLEMVRTGGAMVPSELVERAREHMTPAVYNTYGMTEAFANLTFAYPFEQEDHPGTVGNISFVWEDLRIVEPVDPPEKPDPGSIVDRGETGEVIARGPCMDGYLDNPEADEEMFVDDWLRTGDIAQVDENGGLHIVDRIDNMIVSGGENVYPQEVELALGEHPAVEDVAVVGVDDDQWGQLVAAVVVGEAEGAELDQWCRQHDQLADFKRPRRYAFANGIPRSDTGTVQRRTVLDTHFD